jgi:TolB-like protein
MTTPAPPPGAGDAIAVLPLRNLSDDPGDDYFADGLTDELISRLSDLEGLRVIARTTALGFKGAAEDARSIGRKLGVSHLVTGTVKIADKRLRVTVQLVETEGGIEIASDAYDATIADAFAVQQDMSEVIVQALLPALQDQGWTAAHQNAASPPDSQAYLFLLRARHLIKRREEGSIRRAIALLEEATEMDPSQAELYLALAKAYAVLPYYSAEPKESMFRRAEEVLARGRARGAEIGEPAEGLAAFVALGRWDWVAADHSFSKALAAQPGDADLYQWRSEFYASVGRPELSLTHAVRASELDALSPVVNDRLAVAYLWLNDDERARQMFHDASLLGFGFTANPGAYLISLLRGGEDAKASQLVHALQSLGGGSTSWIDPFIAGRSDPARSPAAIVALEEAAAARAIDPRFLFGAWIYLGELERAMLLAEQMAADRRVLDVEFLFARETRDFRRHERFGALLAAIGIDRYWDVAGWPAWCHRERGQILCGEPDVVVSGPVGDGR